MVADLAGFFLEARGEDVVVHRTDCALSKASSRLFLNLLEADTIFGIDRAVLFAIES